MNKYKRYSYKHHKAHIEDVGMFVNPPEYKEKPVDILTFLKYDRYLGRATSNLRAIYPGWISPIAEIFRDDSKPLVVLTGGLSTGKTQIVYGCCIPYILYRISMLKDPWQYFKKTPSGKMDVVFFNLAGTLSESRGFNYMQNSLQSSPWFKKCGRMIGESDPCFELDLFSWSLVSPHARRSSSIGGNIVAGVMDEVDSPNESDGHRRRVLQAYEGAMQRFESQIAKDGVSLGRLFLVTSKQKEMSFLDVFIDRMKHLEKVRIFDKAQWDIFPNKNYSGETFPVMVGDIDTQSKMIEPEEKDKYIKEGMRVIDVPVEYKHDFKWDLVVALRDLAGITVRDPRRYKFISAERFIRACMDDAKQDPMSMESMPIGLQDEEGLINFIDLSKIRIDVRTPRAIHVDIAFSQDALGFACSTIAGWKDVDVEMPDGTYSKQQMPVVETDFCFRLVAQEGDWIPLHKVRKFILDLKARGLNIKRTTFDLRLASEDTMQILNKAGIETDYLSVDEDTKPYMEFKKLIFEERWICHMHQYLMFEVAALEFDEDKNKIDHSDKSKNIQIMKDGSLRDITMTGGKYISDAVVGSIVSIMSIAKHPIIAEQYTNILKALNQSPTKQSPRPQGFKDDWFMSKGSKKNLGDQDVKVDRLNAPSSNVEKMKKALDQLNRRKRPGGGIF